MKLVGLTGGIGCGKTTVLEEFKRLGVPCFVADQHASDYYQEPDFLTEIRKLFGLTVFLDSSSVDKKKIASIVFSDKEKLLQLNALIHPRVMNDFRTWAYNQNPKDGYVIIESAILYEYNLDKQLDKIIAVYLEKEERMRRLQLRDHTSREALEARMNNQLSAEEKMDRADYVVLNHEGNPRARQVATIHKRITDSII
ncbi:MAG: dephospho-CoA kinase [Bacteroidales bacterium]|nr:dephospho-CoA kinase [Bacteroidales bacterium]